jgi:hypothetical protein
VPHQPPVVRHHAATVAVVALVALAGFAPTASAQTLLTGPTAPLIVQGRACVGEACSTDAPNASFGVRNRNTPLVRLDQADGGGFVPYVWDVGGNEANFFVRDVTNGNALPFRIHPGAQTNSLTLRDGRVGIGTWDPESALHVSRSDGTAALRVSEANGAVADRTLATLDNNGPVSLRMTDTAAGVGWSMATDDDGTVALVPTGPGALPALVLSSSGEATVRADLAAGGNVRAGATVDQTADPARQTDVAPVDVDAVVDAIRTVPIERFGLAGDGGAEHLAPNGAAFRTALNLGGSDTRIAPGDVASVALTGVKALLHGEAGVDLGPLSGRVAALEQRVGGADGATVSLVQRVDDAHARLEELGRQADAARTTHGSRQDARIGAAEQVQHGHERRIRGLEGKATRAEARFERSNRVQKRLRGQVSSLRSENARLRQRLDAIEAAIARRR